MKSASPLFRDTFLQVLANQYNVTPEEVRGTIQPRYPYPGVPPRINRRAQAFDIGCAVLRGEYGFNARSATGVLGHTDSYITQRHLAVKRDRENRSRGGTGRAERLSREIAAVKESCDAALREGVVPAATYSQKPAGIDLRAAPVERIAPHLKEVLLAALEEGVRPERTRVVQEPAPRGIRAVEGPFGDRRTVTLAAEVLIQSYGLEVTHAASIVERPTAMVSKVLLDMDGPRLYRPTDPTITKFDARIAELADYCDAHLPLPERENLARLKRARLEEWEMPVSHASSIAPTTLTLAERSLRVTAETKVRTQQRGSPAR